MAGTKDTPLQPMGFQQIASPAASTALTVPKGAKYAMFNISGAAGAQISFRDDGTAPTTTVGMLLTLGTNYWYTGKLDAVRVINGTTAGTLNVSYYA